MMYDFGAMKEGLKVGDVVPPASIAGLFVPGVARWHALCVKAQKEDAAEQWLARRGVYAFHPVREFSTSHGGKAKTRIERYLPGYVFARFEGAPIYRAVLDGPFVWSAISRIDGQWGVLCPEELRRLHAMRKLAEVAKGRRSASKDVSSAIKRAALRAGSRVMFRAGPFAGNPCEVVELASSGRVSVRLHLFGREALVAVEADTLTEDLLTDGNPPA